MEPFIGQISLMAFNYPPRNWLPCNGALLPISQFQALFSLLGTTYGGDGVRTFSIPDLRGRAVVHPSTAFPAGAFAGTEQVTLDATQIPPHIHTVSAIATPGAVAGPSGNVWAASVGADLQYAVAGTTTVLMAANALNGGPGLPHSNLPPMLALNFCIALNGVFPSRN